MLNQAWLNKCSDLIVKGFELKGIKKVESVLKIMALTGYLNSLGAFLVSDSFEGKRLSIFIFFYSPE